MVDLNKRLIDCKINVITREVVLEHIHNMSILHCRINKPLISVNISNIELVINRNRVIVFIRINLPDVDGVGV